MVRWSDDPIFPGKRFGAKPHKQKGRSSKRPFCFPWSSEQRTLCSFLVPILPVSPLVAEIIRSVAGCVLHLAHCVTGFALSLICQAFGLGFFVPGPLAGLAFDTAAHIFHLALDTVFIHYDISPLRLID